jgi:hypothetical protein
MPEYLAPGVYIEEVSFRPKTIEGVSTSTAGFIGPARFGPTEGEPELLTSFAAFERIYGGIDKLEFAGAARPMDNYLAHAVRAFFEEGGSRLFVTRTYRSLETDEQSATPTATADGKATFTISGVGSPPSGDVTLDARYPGSGGNVRVTFTTRVSQNVLAGVPRDPADLEGEKDPVLRGVSQCDLVWITDLSSPIASPPGGGTLYWAERYFDDTANRMTWRFHGEEDETLELATLNPDLGDEVRIVTVNVQVTYPGRFPRTETWDNLTFHPEHRRSLSKVFAPTSELSSRLQALTVPIVFRPESSGMEGPEIARTLLGQERLEGDKPRLRRLLGLPETDTVTDLSILATLGEDELSDVDRQFTVALSGGNDGVRPEATEYEGRGDDDPSTKSGLKAFEIIPDISIIAAPGSTYDYSNGYQAHASQIIRHLISHCERMRYRIAVLDSADGHIVSEVRKFRGQVDSTHAALYYPWVKIMDPLSGEETYLPPSGFVSGIYARNDVARGVHKAPANEVVRLAIGLEFVLNKAQQDILNPEGVNCFRYFEGRGHRVWGARTISSDPEWKYVNVRRYFAYLERSIERGTQWVVFENNSDALWNNVRRTVSDFLFNEWKSGHLMGTTPEEAYFVRCDRSTMTQNDIDNGRLICLIGVAPVRPAEFVIFRIGQWTADSTS